MPTFLREVHMKRHNLLDILFRNVTRLSAFAVLVLLVAIMVSLIIGSLPSIKAFGFRFLASAEWNPVTDEFGALVPIVGTLVTSAIALLIAIGRMIQRSAYHVHIVFPASPWWVSARV